MRPEEIVEGLERFSKRLGKKLTLNKGKVKERYTITGDVISYSICPRQYGLYRFYGFSPSNPTQEWYGSVIHRFLKRAHSIYRIKGRVISLDEVEEIFRKVETSMEAEGIRPTSPKVREKVISILKEFCRLYGEEFIPKIVEAELRLVKELSEFILYGIVDALKEENGDFEIWDYKGMDRPDPSTPYGKRKLEIYEKQMFVYGYLFKEKNGSYPKKAVLLFMNELVKENGSPLYEIDFTEEETIKKVERFIEEFSEIVKKIEKSKESGKWELPKEIDKKTCSQCNFRFDCEKFSSLR